MTIDRAQEEFDESWYLATNKDVASGVLSGAIKSPRRHFEHYGRAEGRTPRAPTGTYQRVFAYGSFGSNNVGDEAILDGIRVYYPSVVQLFHNKPRDASPAIQYQEMRHRGAFRSGDYLILGGGGLLYDSPTVQLMIDLATNARSAGATVDILRLGCEHAQPTYYGLIRQLFALARFASVRSRASQNIIEQITGNRPVYQGDFAFNLAPRLENAVGSGNRERPTIGLVIATTEAEHLSKLALILRSFTRYRSKQKARFILIPHSRSFFNSDNNDCVSAELLYSQMFLGDEDQDSYQVSPFSPDPMTVLNMYRHLDGVVSSRYHGLVFSQLVNLPSVAMFRYLPKIVSIVDDNPGPGRIVALGIDDLENSISRLINYIQYGR